MRQKLTHVQYDIQQCSLSCTGMVYMYHESSIKRSLDFAFCTYGPASDWVLVVFNKVLLIASFLVRGFYMLS